MKTIQPLDVDLTITRSEGMEEWWVIQRAEHEGRTWMRHTEYGLSICCSSRLDPEGADIEGTSPEMRAIAKAIEDGEAVEHRRCAATTAPGVVLLWSPRNSTSPVAVTSRSAGCLAERIREILG